MSLEKVDKMKIVKNALGRMPRSRVTNRDANVRVQAPPSTARDSRVQTRPSLLSLLSRGAVLIAIVMVWMACMISPSGAASPSIPLMSAHYFWDHHWYVWLPRHPIYEAVEIMSIDTPGNPYKAVPDYVRSSCWRNTAAVPRRSGVPPGVWFRFRTGSAVAFCPNGSLFSTESGPDEDCA